MTVAQPGEPSRQDQDWWSGQPADSPTLEGLAQNPAIPVGLLLELIRRHGGPAAEGLRRRRELPPPVVEAMAHHPVPRVRAALATNPGTAGEIRRRLADDPDRLVALRTVNEPKLPPSEHTLVRSVEALRRMFELGLYTTVDLANEMSFLVYDDHRLMHPVARHPRPRIRATSFQWWEMLDETTRQALLTDEAPEVRTAAAEHQAYLAERARPRLPGDIQPSGRGRNWILTAYPLTRALIDEVLTGNDETDLIALGRNKNLPPDVVTVLLAHPAGPVRQQVARRDDLTGPQLTSLAADPDPAVRTAVSVHPGLTEAQRATIDIDMAATFEDDQCGLPEWRWPLPTQEESTALARSVNPLLRRRAARDPRLPGEPRVGKLRLAGQLVASAVVKLQEDS